MSKRLDAFHKNVAAAIKNSATADAAIVSRLKKLSPEEFARLPRAKLEVLTADQYRDIVAHMLPENQFLDDRKDEKLELTGTASSFLALSWAWPRAVLIGVTFGCICALAGWEMLTGINRWSVMPISRLQESSHWPTCETLDANVDGCLYRVRARLSWKDAAAVIDMPEHLLRRANSDDLLPYVEAGHDLVVWRFRGTLSEDDR